LRRLPEKVATAAVEFIYSAPADNPLRVGRPLRFELEGRHSAHRGDYRVVDRIDEPRRRIHILAIDHRPTSTAAGDVGTTAESSVPRPRAASSHRG
jgi:mRNA-degrading endonuclease RelE of RelBE toxin-antitoxin system